jgi:hypothetical protein
MPGWRVTHAVAGIAQGPGVPGEEEPPYEVLAALVAALRRELAEAVLALGQAPAELAQAGERLSAGGSGSSSGSVRVCPPVRSRRRMRCWPG